MEQTQNKEVWRPAKGFDGIYDVSNYGRIMSRNLYHRKEPVILRSWLGNNGYLRITLRKNGVITHKQIATLVAEAFLPNPSGLSQVNHKDEDKTKILSGLMTMAPWTLPVATLSGAPANRILITELEISAWLKQEQN